MLLNGRLRLLTMRMEAKWFSSISDLVEKLIIDLNGIKGPVWFRGQADKDWSLTPVLVRKNKLNKEIELMRSFKQNATMLVNPMPKNSLEWMFVMQHHGVPTRLLDWTESPLIASYFSVNEKCSVDGALWVIMPLELNKEARVFEIPSSEEEAVMSNYSTEALSGESQSMLLPIGIIAPRNNTRMQAQLSVFTINQREIIPIEEIGIKMHVWRYLVEKQHKRQIIKELEAIGIGKFQLFPELQSIGDELRKWI